MEMCKCSCMEESKKKSKSCDFTVLYKRIQNKSGYYLCYYIKIDYSCLLASLQKHPLIIQMYFILPYNRVHLF